MMTIDQIMERRSQIKEELNKPEADLAALEEEVRQLNDAEKEIRSNAQKAEELRKRVADGLEGEVRSKHGEQADSKPEDVRSSEKYINAFANYIKTGKDEECRKLLTVNASANGTVPVPTFVEAMISTAWEKDEVLSRIRKTDFRGNLNVPFELSATDAVEHEEGAPAITEEELVLGIVELKPKNIKKFIRVSDEVIAMGGRKMLEYIYAELTYRVLKLLKDNLIGAIAGASAADSATAIGIPSVTGAPSLTVIPEAESLLGDDAENLVVIMNRQTSAAFQAARVAGNFAVDPYDGMVVLYSSALPVYSAAGSGATYAIVGDLKGAQANYPEGEEVVTKYDDLSEAEADMVKIHGRQYVGYGVTGKGMFANIKKA